MTCQALFLDTYSCRYAFSKLIREYLFFEKILEICKNQLFFEKSAVFYNNLKNFTRCNFSLTNSNFSIFESFRCLITFDTSFESWDSILFNKCNLENTAKIPSDLILIFRTIGAALVSQNKHFLSEKIGHFKISKIAILKVKKCFNENDMKDLGTPKHSK